MKAFGTEGTAEYPLGFCEAYAAGLKEALEAAPGAYANSENDFVEIFSGINAPLTKAVSSVKIVSPASYVIYTQAAPGAEVLDEGLHNGGGKPEAIILQARGVCASGIEGAAHCHRWGNTRPPIGAPSPRPT